MNRSFGIPRGAFVPETADADAIEDLRLVREAQGGSNDAFRALVERHQQRIHHFCFRYLRDEGDAREACQDTFVRAHAAMSRFEPRAKVSTWLYRIALNLCRDRFRSASRKPSARSLEAGDWVCPAGDPAERAMLGADMAKLDLGLAALPERSRAVLVLVVLDGLSHGECAEVLRCSERAIEGRLYRARRQLASWWEQEG